jgi:hypothetical protein
MKHIVRITSLAILILSVVLTSAAADKTLKELQKFVKETAIGINGNIVFADVNGDGYKDIVARYSKSSKQVGGIWLWRGGKFSDSVDCSIDLGLVAGAAVTAGDLNGDGKADLAFLSNYSNTHPPKIVLGRATWPKTITTPDILCGLPNDPVFESQGQYASLVIADFNSDGFGDVCYQVQGNDTAGAYAGLYGSQLNVYFGGSPMDSIADWKYKGGKAYTITGTSNVITPRYFSPWHMDVGDFNGDGKMDLLTSGWNAYSSISTFNYKGVQQSMYNCGAGIVFLGGTGFAQDTIPDVILMANNDWLKYTTPAQYLWLGYAIYNAGDFNGDGVDDISLPAWYMDIALLFTGSKSWQQAGSDANVLVVRDEALSYTKNRFDFSAYSDQSGVNISTIGDVNGDGLGDLGLTRNIFGTYVPEERGIRLFFTKAGKRGAITPDYETADYIQAMPGSFDYDHDGVSEFFAYDALNQLTVLKVNPVSIARVDDSPADQGGSVRLAFNATVDNDVAKFPYFSIWRALPTDAFVPTSIYTASKITKDFSGSAAFTENVGGSSYRWEWVKNVPAQLMSNYTATVPTVSDSSALGKGKHYFMVIAHTSDPNKFYASATDSGYSVDNLAPVKPTIVSGTIVANKARIAWTANGEKDLRQYLIYKSDVSNIPDNAPVYARTTDTAFVDGVDLGSTAAYFAVKAEDTHGNLSPKSNEVRVSVTGVEIIDSSIPTAYALQQNYPNPFNPSTTIEYALKEAGDVTIKILNVLGEEISTIESGFRAAGLYRVSFDASKLATGVYLYQIRAGNFVDTKRMVLLK